MSRVISASPLRRACETAAAVAWRMTSGPGVAGGGNASVAGSPRSSACSSSSTARTMSAVTSSRPCMYRCSRMCPHRRLMRTGLPLQRSWMATVAAPNAGRPRQPARPRRARMYSCVPAASSGPTRTGAPKFMRRPTSCIASKASGMACPARHTRSAASPSTRRAVSLCRRRSAPTSRCCASSTRSRASRPLRTRSSSWCSTLPSGGRPPPRRVPKASATRSNSWSPAMRRRGNSATR